MRWLVSLLAVTVLAVVIALAARYAQGYVLFVTPRARVEVSMMLFVLVLVLGFLLLYILLRVALHLWQLPQRVQAYRLHRSRNRARSALQEAMSAYLEGDFERTERSAAKGMRAHDSSHLCAALAVLAAQARGNVQKSDSFLALAESERAPVPRLLRMTRARVHYERAQYAEALAVLETLLAATPRYAPALQLASQCRQALSAQQKLSA